MIIKPKQISKIVKAPTLVRPSNNGIPNVPTSDNRSALSLYQNYERSGVNRQPIINQSVSLNVPNKALTLADNPKQDKTYKTLLSW